VKLIGFDFKKKSWVWNRLNWTF